MPARVSHSAAERPDRASKGFSKEKIRGHPHGQRAQSTINDISDGEFEEVQGRKPSPEIKRWIVHKEQDQPQVTDKKATANRAPMDNARRLRSEKLDNGMCSSKTPVACN